MALALENFADVREGTTAFDMSGGNLLVITVWWNTDDGTFTNITYDGTSLTKVDSQNVPGSNQYVEIWYLASPSSGSNNIVTTGTNNFIIMGAYAMSGADSSPIDASSKTSVTSSTSVTDTLTTVADNTWAFACVRGVGAGGGNNANNSGVIDTNIDDGTGGKVSWHSGNVLTPAGNKTVSYIQGVSLNYGLISASFKPDTGGGATTTPTPTLALLGVG